MDCSFELLLPSIGNCMTRSCSQCRKHWLCCLRFLLPCVLVAYGRNLNDGISKCSYLMLFNPPPGFILAYYHLEAIIGKELRNGWNDTISKLPNACGIWTCSRSPHEGRHSTVMDKTVSEGMNEDILQDVARVFHMWSFKTTYMFSHVIWCFTWPHAKFHSMKNSICRFSHVSYQFSHVKFHVKSLM